MTQHASCQSNQPRASQTVPIADHAFKTYGTIARHQQERRSRVTLATYQPSRVAQKGGSVPYSPIPFRARCHRLGQCWNSPPSSSHRPSCLVRPTLFAVSQPFLYIISPLSDRIPSLSTYESQWSCVGVRRSSSARWCCCQFTSSLDVSTQMLTQITAATVPAARLRR